MNLQMLLILIAVLIVYLIVKKNIDNLVNRIGKERKIPAIRVQYVRKVLVLVWSILLLVAIGMIVGIGFEDFGLFFTSVFAVLGVALFAHWSILSNVTASIIVFFFFPYRIGDQVRIVDGDNSVEGKIKEITLFHVILKNESGLVTFPNALTFQKAVQIQVKPAEMVANNSESNSTDVPTTGS